MPFTVGTFSAGTAVGTAVPAVSGASPGYGSQRVWLYISGSASVYIGDLATVGTSTGFPVGTAIAGTAGAAASATYFSFTRDTSQAVYVVATGGGATGRYLAEN